LHFTPRLAAIGFPLLPLPSAGTGHCVIQGRIWQCRLAASACHTHGGGKEPAWHRRDSLAFASLAIPAGELGIAVFFRYGAAVMPAGRAVHRAADRYRIILTP
jgi:hypothetical protein